MKIPGLAALLVAAPVFAFAQTDTAYTPKPGVTLVVHSLGQGHTPDGVTMTDGSATYLFTRDELFKKFAIDVGEEQTLYNIWDFTDAGVRHRATHRDSGSIYPFGHPSSVDALGEVLAKMTGKKTAGPEASDRIQALRQRADRASARRSALLAAENLAPGTVKDKAWLERLDSEIASCRASADRAETESKAGRFVRVARLMTDAEYEMWKLENVLDWSPKN